MQQIKFVAALKSSNPKCKIRFYDVIGERRPGVDIDTSEGTIKVNSSAAIKKTQF